MNEGIGCKLIENKLLDEAVYFVDLVSEYSYMIMIVMGKKCHEIQHLVIP